MRQTLPNIARIAATALSLLWLWRDPAMADAPSADGRNAAAPLQWKFQPDTEWVYEFTGHLRQKMSVGGGDDLRHEMTLTGEERLMTVETDPSRGTALIGSRGDGQWKLTAGADIEQARKEQTWVRAYRMAPSGAGVPRKSAKSNQRQRLLRRAVNSISENSQICAPFPPHPVKIGDSWSGDVLLPTAGTRQPGAAVSTLTGWIMEDGRRCGVIRSEVASGGEHSHDTWRSKVGRPEHDVKGTTEGVFDVERGQWRSFTVRLETRFEGLVGGRGFQGVMFLTSTNRLRECRMIPAGEAAGRREAFREFDRALELLYADRMDAGIAGLETMEKTAPDETWRKGVQVALTLVRAALQAQETAPEENAGNADGAEKTLAIYKRAGELAGEGENERALDAYKEFLAADERNVAPRIRLLAQYRMAALLERMGRVPDATAAYARVETMAGDDEYSRQLKEKAREKTRVGTTTEEPGRP